MSPKLILLTAASVIAMTGVAQAQEAAAGADGATTLQDVIVTAHPLGRSANDVVTSTAVLAGEELVHRRQATLGETLNGLPGVNADTFGAGASRPVIRGQASPRVKVLSDGSGQFDASEVSPDHAVSGEPLLLRGIEILRGPSTLLYGGGAIGGAVNLIDEKVPTRVPANGVEGVGEVRLGTADDERAAVVGATFGAGNLAFRLEGATRRTDDYAIPFDTALGEDHDHDHEEGHEEEGHEEEVFDRLAGSFNETRTATIGASWIGSRGYIGAAYTEQHSEYGLPGHNHEYEGCHPHGATLHCGGHDEGEEDHDHEDEHAHAAPVVNLESRRFDVRGEVEDPVSGVERVRFRASQTDYQHQELEEGVVSTTFTNEGYDARLEVQHAPIAGLRGVIGLQTSDSDFAAIGEESFIAPSNTKTTALFVLEELQAGDWRFEGAARQEWQETSAVGQADTDHAPFSVSLGAHWAFAPGYSATISAARSQRAPHVQELYAEGVHLATNTYELGDADLDAETVHSLEIGLRKIDGPLTFSLSAYRYAYDGYIYAQTLDQYEDFRLIQYTQADATFTGVEGELRYEVTPDFGVSAFGDQVRAELDDGGDLPRIPAGRIGLRTDLRRGAWSGDVEWAHVFEQTRIADYESKTPDYDMINGGVAFDFDAAGFRNQVYLRGTNLLDDKAFNHASFISTLAPLRGRNFVLGFRTRF